MKVKVKVNDVKMNEALSSRQFRFAKQILLMKCSHWSPTLILLYGETEAFEAEISWVYSTSNSVLFSSFVRKLYLKCYFDIHYTYDVVILKLKI